MKRDVRQHTFRRAHRYPLYYFVPSITDDGRRLVFQSERTGWLQLYRLELDTGEITQLTEGRTIDSGWAIWCVSHIRGVFAHLSALDPASGVLYYFDLGHLESVDVATGKRSTVLELGSCYLIGQSSFSPDGSKFAYIHADSELFHIEISSREALTTMGQFNWARDHQAWRNGVPCTVTVLDTQTGKRLSDIDFDFHVHHVLFADEDHLIVNHVRNNNGMLIMNLDGSNCRNPRPADENGAVCHQLATSAGICYEASRIDSGLKRTAMGRYDLTDDTWGEFSIPLPGYLHTGFDRSGDFIFCEIDGEEHALYAVEPSLAGEGKLELLRTLPPIPFGQRHQAHPFLDPERKRLYFTELVDGFSQVMSLDVSDITTGRYTWSSSNPPADFLSS